MKRILLLSFSLALLTLGSLAQADSFAPENNLYIPADQKGVRAQGLSEREFWLAINVVEEAMQPTLRRLNRKIGISANWFNGTVNAEASKDRLYLYGGLARFPGVTLGSYIGVICHEYGHSLKMIPLWRNSVLTSEGQSDYYAGLKCMREVFKKNKHLLLNNHERARLSRKHVDQCNRNQKTWIDRQACSSTLKGGEEMAQVLYKLSFPAAPANYLPRLSTPSLRQTPSTIINGYPDSQCRLDTIATGALCPTGNLREVARSGSRYQISCADRRYRQPSCWFR